MCVCVCVSIPQEVKLYEEVSSLDELTAVVESCLDEYNNTHKTRMNLVIFRYKYMHTHILDNIFLGAIVSLPDPMITELHLLTTPHQVCTGTLISDLPSAEAARG